MINLGDLLNAQVEALRSIPELVQELANASPSSIYVYEPGLNYRDVDEAIKAMLPRTIMVVYDGTAFGEFGESLRLTHDFRMILQADGLMDVGSQKGILSLMQMVVNGDVRMGERFFDVRLMPEVEPFDRWSFRSASDDDSHEYWYFEYDAVEFHG